MILISTLLLTTIGQLYAVDAQTSPLNDPSLKAEQIVEVTKLYTIPSGCGSYMASFIRDEYVIFSSFHMDISWDRSLISSAGDICILKAKTGQLIEKAGPGTYRFDFENAKLHRLNVPFNPLIFSLDSKIGVHDPYHGLRGVYDFEKDETRVIDKDSVPGGLSSSLYPGQVSYDGSIIAVGEHPTGRLVVFEWDGEKYKHLWSSPPLGDIRRIQMSVDGTLIYVGSLTSDLYAYERRGDQYIEKFRVKMNGVGALGLAEPWNPRYLWGGSADGMAFIVNATTGEVISMTKAATSRGYNPFYDRMGISLEGLRFLPIKFIDGAGVIFDLATGEWIKYSHSELGGGSVATTSETNKFIALGRTVFEVTIKQRTLKLLVVGTCYADEDFEQCREELKPVIDYKREDSPVFKAVKHLEKETLGVYKIEVYPDKPLIITLPDTSKEYPDADEGDPTIYDPPIGEGTICLPIPPNKSKYRHDVENELKKQGYKLDDYNAILAVQTEKVLQAFNAKFFRAVACFPHKFRSWGFAALSTIHFMNESGGWKDIILKPWTSYAHELGHALFHLNDYYGSSWSGGQLYAWSLMGDHYGWNFMREVLREDATKNLRIYRVITEGALLDVYNKLEVGVLRKSFHTLGDVEIDLVPTEEIIADSLAYVIKGRQSTEYYIEARTTSIKESFRNEKGIEGGVVIYLSNNKYIYYMQNMREYHSYAPTLFVSDDPATSILSDPVGFRVFELIRDVDNSSDKFRPRIKISWCYSCKNINGVVITASPILEAGEVEVIKPIQLNYTLKLYGITRDGRIIGFDPLTDLYRVNVSGAYASGPGLQQWLFIPKDLDTRFFIRYEKNDPSLPSIPIMVNVTWIEYGANPRPKITIGKVEITNSTINIDESRILSPGQTIFIKPNETIVLEGDINGDGTVNHIDLALLAKHYSSRFGEARYLLAADLNVDGRIDYLDLAILAKNYGKQYTG
ncbi:MAG: dockerin type I domain-containing protein [Candidatus Bathyarchaeia archaeon]